MQHKGITHFLALLGVEVGERMSDTLTEAVSELSSLEDSEAGSSFTSRPSYTASLIAVA